MAKSPDRVPEKQPEPKVAKRGPQKGQVRTYKVLQGDGSFKQFKNTDIMKSFLISFLILSRPVRLRPRFGVLRSGTSGGGGALGRLGRGLHLAAQLASYPLWKFQLSHHLHRSDIRDAQPESAHHRCLWNVLRLRHSGVSLLGADLWGGNCDLRQALRGSGDERSAKRDQHYPQQHYFPGLRSWQQP